MIAQCDRTIEAKNKALELSDLALKKCSEHSSNLSQELSDTQDSLNAWYRNPFVIGLIGVLAGGIAYSIVVK